MKAGLVFITFVTLGLGVYDYNSYGTAHTYIRHLLERKEWGEAVS